MVHIGKRIGRLESRTQRETNIWVQSMTLIAQPRALALKPNVLLLPPKRLIVPPRRLAMQEKHTDAVS
jgi:hypothetical protein